MAGWVSARGEDSGGVCGVADFHFGGLRWHCYSGEMDCECQPCWRLLLQTLQDEPWWDQPADRGVLSGFWFGTIHISAKWLTWSNVTQWTERGVLSGLEYKWHWFHVKSLKIKILSGDAAEVCRGTPVGDLQRGGFGWKHNSVMITNKIKYLRIQVTGGTRSWQTEQLMELFQLDRCKIFSSSNSPTNGISAWNRVFFSKVDSEPSLAAERGGRQQWSWTWRCHRLCWGF